MFLPGCKPPFRLVQEVSGSVEQYSWYRPPIWPLLLDVQSWFTRSFPLTYSITLTPTLSLLLNCGGKVIHTHTPIHPASCAQIKWDAPRIEATFNSLLESANQLSQARLLAVSRPESGTWLNALPLSSMGLRMDDVVIIIAVGLRLGLPLCHPHECSNCGTQIEEFGTHGLSCCFSRGRHSRHALLNDIIKRSLNTAKIPSHLEPSGFYRSDGKRPDGASVVPWTRGKILVWEATCVDTLAPSHRVLAAREAGAVADDAEHCKRVKYTHLESTHYFIPVAIETLGAMGQEV